MLNKLTKFVKEELGKLSEKEREILRDKATIQKESASFNTESLRKIIGEELKSITEASVDKVKNDLLKAIDSLKKNLVLYKKAKDSGNEKDTEKYKKTALLLTKAKKKLESDLDKAIGGLYADAELQMEAKLARGLQPLLKVGTTITKKTGEDALLKLSDKFDKIDDEYAGEIASWLDMAIELMQDGYAGPATKKLKQFNQKCKDVLKGKSIKSAFAEGKLTESMIGIQTKANFKPNSLKGALEKAGIKGFQMNRLSVTLTALKLDKKYFNDAKKIIDGLGLNVMMAKESVSEAKLRKGDIVKMQDGEYGVVNKVKGRVAYIKLDSNPGSFHPIEALRTKYKGKHKGKDLYIAEGQLNEITAKETLTNAVSALTKTIGGRKLDKGYIKDYLKSMEKMARKNPGTFVKDYGEFDVSDWLEDVRYNLQNEGKLNEEDYKYKKYASKAFKEINDAMFNFRHSMGIKTLTNKDMKLKKKVESLHQAIFSLQKEMKKDGLTEASSLWKHFDAKMKLQDTIMDLEYDMKMINKDLSQLHRDMEQEAEPAGGKIADRYGREIDKKEKEYKKKKAEFKKLMAKLDRMEQF